MIKCGKIKQLYIILYITGWPTWECLGISGTFFTPGITWKIHIFPFFYLEISGTFQYFSVFLFEILLSLKFELWFLYLRSFFTRSSVTPRCPVKMPGKTRKITWKYLEYTWKMQIKICWPPFYNINGITLNNKIK